VPAASTDYRPRAPERDVLRGVICEHLETFLDRVGAQRDGETLQMRVASSSREEFLRKPRMHS